MSNINIIVVPESIAINSSGIVTGQIFIVLDGVEFPSGDWDDFVVTILGWWLSEVSEVMSGNTHETHLRFMDGPYMVGLSATPDRQLELQLVARGAPVYHKTKVDAGELLAEIIGSSARVLTVCRERGWRSEDIDSLGGQVAAAKSILPTKLH